MEPSPSLNKQTKNLTIEMPISKLLEGEGAEGLVCYLKMWGQWKEIKFSTNDTRIRIGKDPHECEIVVREPDADAVHVILQKAGTCWYIIESGKKDIMTVDGFQKRQGILRPEDRCSLLIGKTSIILSTMPSEKKLESKSLMGEPQTGEFTLTVPKGEFRFKFEKACLIGSHPICDLLIQEQLFTAIITHFEKRLFLSPLSDPSKLHIECEGKAVEKPVALSSGNTIKIATSEIQIRVSKELDFPSHESNYPEMREKHLCLLRLDNEGNPCAEKIIFPSAGHSVFIGRDPQCDFQVPSQGISRKHIQAIIYEKSALVLDCYSKNGTFVNGEKIGKRTIHPGDILSAGDVNFILCYSD